MKKFLVLLIFLMGLVFPWACSDNKTPSQPSGPIVGTTPSGTATVVNPTVTGTLPTSTATGTPTPTGIINTNTPTASPTITWTFRPTPAYDNNYGTAAAPNGMYYDAVGSIVYVAEAESRAGTMVDAFEEFSNLGSGALTLVYGPTGVAAVGNLIIVGQATPCALYQPTPQNFTVTSVHAPQGVAVSSPFGLVGGYPGMVEVLDLQSNGAATLYAENNYNFCPPALDGGPFMNNTTGFEDAPFNNPKCLTADKFGNFYVTDTGNGYVDEFDGGGTNCTPLCSPGWIHRWNGPGAGYSASMNFKAPNSLATDSAGNIYVGDPGPYSNGGVNTSMVQVYTSGGTSLIGAFFLIPGCVVNGLTVDSAGDFFVSDTSNGEIEEYQMLYNNSTPWVCCSNPVPAGTVLTNVGEVTAWGDPHSPHEFLSYEPSCVQSLISGGQTFIVSGDSGNDLLNVFGPLQ